MVEPITKELCKEIITSRRTPEFYYYIDELPSWQDIVADLTLCFSSQDNLIDATYGLLSGTSVLEGFMEVFNKIPNKPANICFGIALQGICVNIILNDMKDLDRNSGLIVGFLAAQHAILKHYKLIQRYADYETAHCQ